MLTDVTETKTCPHCAETIKAPAKVCPNCRLWQKRWSLYNPILLLSIYTIVMGGLLAYVGTVIEQYFAPKEDFREFRDKIVVVSSQVSMRNNGSNTMVAVAGILTNRSDLAWKEVGVEVQFFDKSGKVFDVIPVKAEDFTGIGMLPHAEGGFKVEGRAARPNADYDHYTAIVRWAKDARKAF
jgi:hypothetical protein